MCISVSSLVRAVGGGMSLLGRCRASLQWACITLFFKKRILHNKGLVTNYGEGGATKREGGHMKFYPYEKGGRKKF